VGSFVRVAVVVALTIVGASCDSSPLPEAPPRMRPATWHVEGNALRDPSGRTVVLRGVNLSGAHKLKPYFNDFGPADYARVRNEWGLGSARFLMTVVTVRPK